MANLIDLSTYKDLQGITSITSDFILSSLIDSVSELVKTYCGNSIIDYYTTNKVETLNIDWDTHVAQLTESPVNTIVSVEERKSYNSEYTVLNPLNFDYYFDSKTDSVLRTYGGANYCNWAKGPGSVRVTYTAGYQYTPLDLRLAVVDLVTYYFKGEHKQRQTLAGASVQNASSTSLTNNVAFPDHIKRVLDLYKNF